MKHSLFALLFLSFSLQAVSQTQMIINTTSGADSILLSDIKSITFKTAPTILSVSVFKDSVQYTFTIPKSSFSIHDTLTGTLIAQNQSSEVDTLGVDASDFQWTLKNSDGQIILQGPLVVSGIFLEYILNPKQSILLFQLDGTNVRPGGGPVVPGNYSLNATFHSMLFTLNISFY